MNVRDSDVLGRRLEAAGFVEAPTEDDADIIIVNSCSVREKAEDKAIGKLRMLCAARRTRPSLVVGLTGCMANRLGESVFKLVPGLSFSFGPRSGWRVAEIVASAVAGETGIWTPDGDGTEDLAISVPKGGSCGSAQGFVTILYGCNQHCSYCIVPAVRGREVSRDPGIVLEEVRAEAARGVKDICLLGQSVMRYGRLGFEWPSRFPSALGFTEPFPRLLELIAREVPQIRRIRFTSGHPLGVTPELVRAMAEIPAVCAHLHLPMQSGSDRILREMRRGYDSARYLQAVELLRNRVPDIAITTDIIVGYPGETEADFEATRRVMDEAQFDNAFIFKYSPRPGTTSALQDDDVPEIEKCRRDQVLLADQDIRSTRINEKWVGRMVEVLCDGPSLRNASRWSGRTEQNKIVVFDTPVGVSPGTFASVKIESAHPQTLFGKFLGQAGR